MVDTIAFDGHWPLRDAYAGLPDHKTIPHKKVRYKIRDGAVVRFEASLPRLLFGNNSRLLTTEAEFRNSLNRLRDEVAVFADISPVESWPLPVRIDLTWQIDVKKEVGTTARAFILALSSLRIPIVRKGATLHPDCEGVSWRGKRSQFMLTIYNKSRETRLPGDLVRAEVRLVGSQVTRYLDRIDWRDIDGLRCCFLGFMAKVPNFPPCAPVENWRHALGLEEPEVINRVMARLQPHVSPRTFRRHRAETAAVVGGRQPWPRLVELFYPYSVNRSAIPVLSSE